MGDGGRPHGQEILLVAGGDGGTRRGRERHRGSGAGVAGVLAGAATARVSGVNAQEQRRRAGEGLAAEQGVQDGVGVGDRQGHRRLDSLGMSDGVFWPEFEQWMLAHGLDPRDTAEITWRSPHAGAYGGGMENGPQSLEVLVYKRNENGRIYKDASGGVATETRIV